MKPDAMPQSDDSLPIEDHERLIAACDRFAEAWQSDAGTQIEDVLLESPEGLRPRLLRDLIALEIELRRGRGDRPAPEEYRVRFPEDTTVVDSAFAIALAS